VATPADTGEVLDIVNRPGNRPSHEGSADMYDRAVALLRKAGFLKISLRGDTDFALTGHFDRWGSDGVRFVFGYDSKPNIRKIAEQLPASAWRRLERPAEYHVKTEPRGRRENIKDEIVRERGYRHLRLDHEDIAEFDYRPGKCGRNYRMVVVRKTITVRQGENLLLPEVEYFFYITNERDWTAQEVVFFSNDRCDQENLPAQLKNGVNALQAPVDALNSNWAYMAIAALAWSAKAWFALLQPSAEHTRPLLRMEFKTFLWNLLLVPCQIVRQAGALVWRLLSPNSWTRVLLEAAARFKRRL
jgi:hypothetical protein